MLELGEGHDLVEALADLGAAQAVDRPVQEDVLATREVGVEARAELEQRADPPADGDAAARRLDDPGDDAQQGRLAGAVAADEAHGLARRDRERHITQRLDVVAAGAAPLDEEVLERASLSRVHVERPRDALRPDLSRFHAGAGSAAARRTSPASTRTKTGSAFGISILRRRMPSSRARPTASVSRSQRISR